ncbi:HNH endonuclease signature motif containing protein [Amycolatopsis palatopharyngis]|uniref:HNH endonuclease signature motif containing protein n=1 Tax=Amycolatopsis palatopharyngis TaxID=187982 RepID=UPI001FE28379|nr:HNH endonuclease signature motif containing protein [Amycolatopsis palatopharyngis]
MDVDEQVIPAWQLSEGELLGGLLESEKVLRRQYGRMLELVAETEKRGAASAQGYAGTVSLLMMALHLTRAEAKARVAQAATPMPLVEEALRAGEIGLGQVAQIQKVLAQAPDALPEAERLATENTLVELGCQANATQVAKVGQRILGHWDVENAPPKDREQPAGPYREFHGRYRRDGQYVFSGQLDPESAGELEGVMHPLAKPDPADADGTPDRRSHAQRQGDALAEIISRTARADDLPTTGGERAVVTVTISLAELEQRAETAMLNASGYTSISQLRRWCCEAKVLPAVLGTQGEVLDLGRAQRLATPAQRRALAIRDRGCTRPGCTRGPKWCQVHHVISWIDDGLSDLDNMILLCAKHHRELHHTGWSVRIRHGTPEFTPPEWLDPEQQPLRNTAHDPPGRRRHRSMSTQSRPTSHRWPRTRSMLSSDVKRPCTVSSMDRTTKWSSNPSPQAKT